MDFIKKIIQTDLFKISTLNSLSVGLKIGTSLITSKLLAIFVGPSGMGLIGNLRNFISSLEGISTLGFQGGIVKYIGESEHNKKELEKTITTVLLSFLLLASFLSLFIFIFSDYFCNKFLENNLQYSNVFRLVAIVLPWNVISILFVSILNGLGEFKKVILVNIIANILSVLLSAVLVYNFKIIGAFIATIIVPIISVFSSFFWLPKEIEIFKRFNFKDFDFRIFKNLISFSLMILPPTILSPYIYLQIRNYLIINVGLNQSGFWEGMSRISTLYLMFVGTIVSVYFYPKLIKSNTVVEVKKVIWSYYKFILPLFIFGAMLVYFLRFLIIKLIFTAEFLPVSELFFWQLIGDVFKVCGLILGFLLMSQKRVLHFIVIEVSALLFLYFASLLFIKNYGVEGVVMGQALENVVYFVVLGIYFRKYLL